MNECKKKGETVVLNCMLELSNLNTKFLSQSVSELPRVKRKNQKRPIFIQ